MFECNCERCQDPTEFETYYGGLYCTKCNTFNPDGEQLEMKGISYQENPLQTSDWNCNHCKEKLPGDECRDVLKRLHANILEAIANSPGSTQVMELVKMIDMNCIFAVKLNF